MMPWWVLLIFVLGANFALWGTVGLVRLAESLAARRRPGRVLTADLASTGDGGRLMAVTSGDGQVARAGRVPPHRPLSTADVAVLIPAHNEALVIEDSLRSIMALVPGEECPCRVGRVH